MRIKSVVIVKDLDDHRPSHIVIGELPGPWPSVAMAVREALLPGQQYRVTGGVLYAQSTRDTQ